MLPVKTGQQQNFYTMSFTRSTTDKKLVTAIAYMDTREINPNLINQACDNGFDDLMLAIKRYKPTKQADYHHFVNEDVLQVLEFDTGGVAGSGTPTLTVTITSTGFARRGLKLLFENDAVGMINSAITTAGGKDSFTITSVNGGNLTAAAGDKVSAIGIVVGEGSKEVQSINYGQTKYFNQIETLRDKRKISDIQSNTTVEIGNGYYIYTQAEQQAIAFKLQLSATLTAGVKSANQYGTASPSLVDENGGSVQTTGGWVNEIESYGVKDSVATPGTVGGTDVDDLLDQLNAVKAPADYIVAAPDAAWRKYDDYFKNLGSSGVTSARLNVDGTEVNLNVNKFTKGRFTLEFASLRLLDHPQLSYFAGSSSLGKKIYGWPKDNKVKVVDRDGKGSSEPRIGVRYLPNKNASNNRGTEYIEEWYTGALAPTPTDGEHALTSHMLTHQGTECLGTKQMFRQIVLS